jgi:hypothetical protein
MERSIVVFENEESIPKYPHCDQDVLHRPLTCDYCDMHPNLQEYRLNNKINFTGENKSGLAQCPSDAKRGLGGAHIWYGNRPKLEFPETD